MAEYHVGAGCFGIYAGTINKRGNMWQNKTECTDEALAAVRDYLFNRLEDGESWCGYEWTRKDGRIVTLMLSVRDANMREVQDG